MQPYLEGLLKFSVHIYMAKTYNIVSKGMVKISMRSWNDYFLRHLVGFTQHNI